MSSPQYKVLIFDGVKSLSNYLSNNSIIATQINNLLDYFPMFDSNREGISYTSQVISGYWNSWEKTLRTIIILDDNVIIGHGQLLLRKNYAEVINIAVVESRRKQGIGKELLIELEDIAVKNGKTVFLLWCEQPTQSFYSKFGYVSTGHKKTEDGYDLYKMSKKIIK